MLEVLVADDDENVRTAVAGAITNAGHRVTEARDGAEAIEAMTSRVYDLAICDIHMPRVGGMALLRRIRRDAPQTAVVMMTAFGEVPDVVGSIRDGAIDFVTKPFDPDEFTRTVVGPLAEHRGLRKAFDRARAARVGRATGAPIVAESPAMRAVVDRIQVLANADTPVLLSGERGAGKELVARAIHEQGPRRCGPWVIAEGTLLEDALGQEGGSRHPQESPEHLFEAAEGGTLVLDGIDRLSPYAQVRLLRLVDAPYAIARRTPARESRGVRLLTLTRVAPDGQPGSGGLLDALFYRLNGVHLRVPPLRERIADLGILVSHLLDGIVPAGTTRPGITPGAWKVLTSYPFPGNVRELRWALEHAVALSDGDPIDAGDLPDDLRAGAGSNGVTAK
ncbi:MAG TPA: response regulator [Polyangiaceae bacterium]